MKIYSPTSIIYTLGWIWYNEHYMSKSVSHYVSTLGWHRVLGLIRHVIQILTCNIQYILDILFSIRNPYINRFTNHFSIHSFGETLFNLSFSLTTIFYRKNFCEKGYSFIFYLSVVPQKHFVLCLQQII
jgi:hypothetical protein